MSVLLFYPPNYFVDSGAQKKTYGGLPERWAKVPPLGVLYLASALEKNGIPVRVIDANALEIGLKESVGLVKKYNPRIVGISATSFQLRGAFQLAKRLREEFENEIVIGLGGAHVSVDPDFINRFPLFDFGLVGDGEITFPKLSKRILDGEAVKGIFYGEQPINLDEIPFPARHLISKHLYFSPGEEYTTILASRGCPYNCVFCAIKGLRSQRVRLRSPKNIADEMQQVKDKYDIERFWFVDDTFTVNKGHTLKLCEEIINRKLDVRWSCETRVDCVDEPLLKAIYKAGCWKISFGIESGSERVRISVVRKNFTNEEVLHAFHLCKKIGIRTEAYFMLGFPTETKENMYQTVDLATKIGADIIGVHITQIMPGSDLFRLAKGSDIISDSVYDHYARGELEGHLPVYIPKGLSVSDVKKARKDAYRRFYFNPRFVISKLAQDLGSWRRLKEDVSTALMLYRQGKTSGEPL